jgi:hypothetical protein
MQGDVFERIRDQAQKALDEVPFETPVGAYGVSMREMRLGNILAITAVAWKSGTWR